MHRIIEVKKEDPISFEVQGLTFNCVSPPLPIAVLKRFVGAASVTGNEQSIQMVEDVVTALVQKKERPAFVKLIEATDGVHIGEKELAAIVSYLVEAYTGRNLTLPSLLSDGPNQTGDTSEVALP